MSFDVRQTVPVCRSWTTDSASTESSFSRKNDVNDSTKIVSLAESSCDPVHEQMQSIDCVNSLNRQSSTLTQIVSNRSIKDFKNPKAESFINSFDSINNGADSRIRNHSSCNSSSDGDDTTYSHVTTTTATASVVPNTPNTSSLVYTSFSDVYSEGETRMVHSFPTDLPLHLKLKNDDYDYYRIVYRGVVGLLSAPSDSAPRSGIYLSYGEIFASRKDLDFNCAVNRLPTCSLKDIDSFPPITHETESNNTTMKHNNNQMHRMERRIPMRVDLILTGGYAIDAPFNCGNTGAEILKLSNNDDNSVDKQLDATSGAVAGSPLGYLFESMHDVIVTEKLTKRPGVEEGKFLYKVTSSAPLQILTGPSFDAPRTKALLLPGSFQDISLRLSLDPEDMCSYFLRLSHRRGWIVERQRISAAGGSLAVMERCDDRNRGDDDNSITLSSTSNSTAGNINSRLRHRPPRRRRNENPIDAMTEKSLPRQIVGHILPVKNKLRVHDLEISERLINPSSNVSIISQDSSFDHGTTLNQGVATASDASHERSKTIVASKILASTSPPCSYFFLMRVTAPNGLKILDAPQFQVNHLIRGKHIGTNVLSSYSVTQLESSMTTGKTHHSIFQTMSGRLSTTGPSKTGNPAVFDVSSKTRILPRGAIFEASRRMENTGAFSQGAGLIKLSDNSGWAIVPRQDELDNQYRSFTGGVAGVKEGEATRSYEEIGNAIISSVSREAARSDQTVSQWIRIITRGGVRVHCSPPTASGFDGETSPSSSKATSSVSGANMESKLGHIASSDSDIASSVGSSFLDAMFRTPRKKHGESTMDPPTRPRFKHERQPDPVFPTVSCGCVVEVEKWVQTTSERSITQEFVRLRGGQGWVPMHVSGKITAVPTSVPEIRNGSFWFRVESLRGMKVRSGPSNRAPSIKTDEGVHFRFECGEFLRASEILSITLEGGILTERFAKLYRNRHVQLQEGNCGYMKVASLTSQAEWVQVYGENEYLLDECTSEPRIERHRQGWRYNVVPDVGVEVRKGPSFSSEKAGIILLGGESILINERVSSPEDKITWLRMKDGQGWVYDLDEEGENIMIAHSLRYRSYLNAKQRKQEIPRNGDDIAYNTIIARLFHNSDGADESSTNA